MGDTERLLLVLGIIYLAECLIWVPGGAILFSSWRGQCYRVRYPGQGLGNARGGWLMANPLPPLGRVFLNAPMPVSLSPQGVYGYVTASVDPAGRLPQNGAFVTWQDLRDLRFRGKKLLANATVLAACETPEAARLLFSRLDRLRKVSSEPAREEELCRQWGLWFDEKSARARWEAFEGKSRRMRGLANVLWVYLFGVAPWLVLQFGMGNVGWGLAAGLLAQTVTLAVWFRRAHRELYPEEGESRFRHFLTMLLAPPSAIRAPDLLGRPLWAGYHPLVVGHLLMSGEEFACWSRLVWADLKHPLRAPVSSGGKGETEAWHRRVLLEQAEKFLVKAGLDPSVWEQPPARTDPGHRSYCPRCLAQYCLEEGHCADCGGVRLRGLEGRPALSERSESKG